MSGCELFMLEIIKGGNCLRWEFFKLGIFHDINYLVVIFSTVGFSRLVIYPGWVWSQWKLSRGAWNRPSYDFYTSFLDSIL